MNNFCSNLNVYKYDYMTYRKMICNYYNPAGTKSINISYYNSLSKFKLSEECTVFDLLLEDIPRVINDLSFTSSYGLDEPKCIIVPFNAEVVANSGYKLLSGAIIKIYLPKGIDSLSIYDKYEDEALKLNKVPNDNGDMSWDGYLGRKFNNIYSYGIEGYKYPRTHSIIFTGSADPDAPNNAELAVHMTIPYNEHFGLSSLVWYDLRPNVFTSTLFSNILFNNKKSTLVNGTLICDDFCKFYLGSPTTEL